jgi:hypothetical protein
MSKLAANTTIIAVAGATVVVALSLSALGSAGAKSDMPGPSDPRAVEDCTCAPGMPCKPVESDRRHFRCLPLAKVGESCGPASAVCDEPAFCDDTGHCALGQAGLGQACAGNAECKTPLVCPWAKHLCSAPGKMGQSCHTNPGGRSECAAGLGCDGIRCVTKKLDGQACVADEECKAGACQPSGCGQAGLPSFATRASSFGD